MKEKGILWVRLLAGLGMAISAYLVILKATGQISSIAGCGDGSGCANVLGSRWSQVFHLPVSALALACYGGIFALTFRPHPVLIQAAAYLLFAAAAWFMGLQLLLLKTFCPWCLATHITGVATGIALLRSRTERSPASPSLALATGGILCLVLGQLVGPTPDTHLLTSSPTDQKAPGVTPASERKAGERLIGFPDRQDRLPLKELPHFGPQDAPHLLVKYFDYTCGSCRDMHKDLAQLQATYPGQVTVVVLPTPLNRACNKYLSPQMMDHEGACELAKLALIAWKYAPDDFPAFHEFLFQSPTPTQARAKLKEYLPREALAEGLQDDWADQRIQAHTEDYRRMTARTARMPKLVIDGASVMHGLSKSTEAFVATIAKQLGL
ncbi:vitamin K epoxide reductase family protein [Roseibacillus ishigakijimensis]|uniref:Vitamin K epoxide reductase family protein n=1 Tax=Roseibacillus ishigakijimensis TaxID=454146 RepID=A0A934RPE5_9BACT|nr:vitamin K epoxide reductase family protein [Roseibacillus ishigakijimensis]MBK1832689.1 vitamin K epoxide reductase family protein [Roseibacillus ishigakijimensis]